MSSDQETISNLLRNITPHTSNEYAHVQWIDEITDKNNGNYNNGLIQFDCTSQKDRWIDYKNAFITIPLSITGATATSAAVGSSLNVALKNGVAQLIYNFQLTINDHKIENTDNINRFAAIMQMVEDSFDYQNSTGSMYHLAKDTYNGNDSAEFSISGGNVTGRNPAFNKGFYDRIQFLKSSYSLGVANSATSLAAAKLDAADLAIANAIADPIAKATAIAALRAHVPAGVGVWNTKVVIPLALISRFFRELDIPLFNCRVLMNIGVTDLMPSSNATAIMADGVALGLCGNAFKMVIGNTSNVPGVNMEQNCRLYLPHVTFSPSTQAQLSTMISSGFTKVVTFYDTKSYVNSPALGANSSFNYQLTSCISAPQKLWLTSCIAGQDLLQSSPSPCQSTGVLTNCNIMIDGNRHYSSDLTEDFQFYGMLKKEFYNGGDQNDSQGGSLVTYSDFADRVNGNHRYYVFDISRTINSNPNPLKTFALNVKGTMLAAGTYDIWVHIQYRVVAYINMSEGKATTIGS